MKRRERVVLFLLIVILFTSIISGCETTKPIIEEPNVEEPNVTDAKQFDFPNKPIKLLVGFAPGGGSDINARILANAAEKYIGQSMVVENRPGAGGGIAYTLTAEATKDGYTLGFVSLPGLCILTNSKQIPMEANQLQPLIQLVEDPCILAVKANGDIKSLDDFIEKAKQEEMLISITGSSEELLVAAMKKLRPELKLKSVTFDGQSTATAAVLGDHVDATLPKLSETTDEMLLLGAFADEIIDEVKDVPLMKEAGLDVQWSSSRGIFVSKGTPKDIVDYLYEQLKKATEDPEYIKQMENAGLRLKTRNVEEFENFVIEQDDLVKELLDEIDL